MPLHDQTLQRRRPMRVAGLALRTDNATVAVDSGLKYLAGDLYAK